MSLFFSVCHRRIRFITLQSPVKKSSPMSGTLGSNRGAAQAPVAADRTTFKLVARPFNQGPEENGKPRSVSDPSPDVLGECCVVDLSAQCLTPSTGSILRNKAGNTIGATIKPEFNIARNADLWLGVDK
ncbi:uncharacterized protein BDCG_06572 [Blastomyces dermatitidis ER-3]|uniref:Uncharacterized protein n=1 Tax=Ajellomyces dermatitidis (strain ER-3 / ATCC MYA-2586) TaxID=559297 RepID=A0ABP2F6N2_AJEDR|nr:uncharacterized protein BDCG_06572 [Blastomyces dermatitidis ER-3]EEQ91452.2 hypothetical protein BDCG_06572 [Blastomyces dermatitidis ER-3]